MASRAAVRRGPVWIYSHDEDQAAADPAGHPPFRSCRGKCGFFGAASAVFHSLILSAGESINTARKPVVPERGKTGVYNTILSVYCNRSFRRKGSKNAFGKKMIAKTVQGIHRCRMSYGSGGVRYAGLLHGHGNRTGRASTYTRRAMKRPMWTRAVRIPRRKPAYPPDTNGFTLAYKRSDFSWSHSDSVNFSKKGLTVGPAEQADAGRFVHGALGESVNWFAGGSIISGFEDRIWDSFTFAPRGGLTFSPTYDLKFHVGAAG